MLRFDLMGTLCLCFEKYKKKNNFPSTVSPLWATLLFTLSHYYYQLLTYRAREDRWVNEQALNSHVMVYPWILAMTLFGVFPEQWVPTTQKTHYISLSLYPNNAHFGYLQVMHSYQTENILHSHHTENTLCLGLPHIPVMAIWVSSSGVHMLHRKCAMCFPWTVSSA